MAQQKRKHLAPRILGWLIFLAILTSPVVYLYLHEEAINVTVTTVTRGHVEETVSSISAGTVVPREDSMIAAGTIGTVRSVPEEGKRFNEGEVLVELDHAEMDAQVALAEANLCVGLSRLEQVKLAASIYREVCATRVNMTSAQLEYAKAEFDRIKNLSDKKAISQSDLDKAVAALRVAQETHAAAKASQAENQIRDEEVRSAEAAIEQIKAGIQVAQATRERSIIKAPFPGVVAKRLMDIGEATAMGMPLVQFVRDDECYVRAPFDEANAAEVKIGQKAKLSLDAYRDVEFMGEVIYLSPTILAPQVTLAAGGGAAAAASAAVDLSRTVEAKIRIDEGREKFIPGMSVDVTIIVQSKDDVVCVPSETLIREEFAYAAENGHAVRRSVKTGIGNWKTAEVLDGLKEGDKLITSIGVKELEDGVKINVVDQLDTE